MKQVIGKMQAVAMARGGKCLSTTYVNSKTKLEWQCKKGHTWSALKGNVIGNNQWCPYCAGTIRLTLQHMQDAANARGGSCLSKQYVNSGTKLKWCCKEGHIWETVYDHIKQGQWCPICSRKSSGLKRRDTLENMQTLAESKGGRCLSEQYNGVNVKLKWQCKEGHTWETTPTHIKRGQWCPCCAGVQRKTLDDMHALAKKQEGLCLSLEYISMNAKLRWMCKHGHEWTALPSNISKGHWCPTCAFITSGLKRRKTIEEMRNIAKTRNGECLSEKYEGDDKNLIWRCRKGHVWEATPSNTKRDKWCPECTSRIGERVCREYFQRLFKKSFPKIRPQWLTTPKGTRQEFDGYCEELKLAFEYNGQQHYDTTKKDVFIGRTLQEQQDADENKRRICKEYGITLIEVPFTVKLRDIGKYIVKQCENLGVNVPNIDAENEDYQKFNCYSDEELLRIQKIAKENEGECLSQNYINSKTKMEFRCKKGHTWFAVPTSMTHQHTWCPTCARRKKLTIEEMRELAIKREGICLSSEYVNSGTKLRWKCKYGHEWEAVPESIKYYKTWCPVCGHSKIWQTRRLNQHAGR